MAEHELSRAPAWTMREAMAAMWDALRQSLKPGLILAAGCAYQFVILGATFGSLVYTPVLKDTMPGIGRNLSRHFGLTLDTIPGGASLVEVLARGNVIDYLLLIPLALILFRFAAGLATISPPAKWDAARGAKRIPSLWSTWKAGRGLGLAGLGMWLSFIVMMFIATLIFVGPVKVLLQYVKWDGFKLLATMFSGAFLTLLMAYSFMLSILFQLALQSLARNRRGVGSAIQHAWRIVKADTRGTLYAAVADVVLVTVTMLLPLLLTWILFGIGTRPASGAQATADAASQQGIVGITLIPIVLVVLVVYGVVGCSRSGFWARAYRQLGGITTTVDGSGP